MTTRETLEAARAKIADEQHWIRGKWTDGAGRYCALGAIEAVDGPNDDDAKKALRRVIPPRVRGLGLPSIIMWPIVAIFTQPRIAVYNDTQTHECVIAAFDRAIEKEKL